MVSERPDHRDSEEEAGDDGDFSNLLRDFDDATNLDDQVASDLDAGLDIEPAPDLPEDTEQPPIDVAEVIDVPTEMASLVDPGDEFGPADDDDGSDPIETLADPVETEDGDGVTGDTVETLELSELDSQGDDDELPAKNLAEDLGLSFPDDPKSPALPWLPVPLAAGPPRTVVVSSRDTVMAAGTEISSLDESGESTVLVEDTGSPVTSLLSTPDGATFYTTRRGDLWRTDSRGSECVTAWTDAFGKDRPAQVLELGGMTPSGRPAILLRVEGDRKELLESTDHGSTFRRIELDAEVLALSSGTPPVCIVKTERALRVLRSEATGGFSVTCPAYRSEPTTHAVAVHGSVVAVVDRDKGVQVSADGGRTFRAVEGFARATAVAAGVAAGRPVAFAALFDDATEATQIALVDPTSSEAVIVAGIDATDDDDGDRAQVLSLAWNEHTETLWAAGAFGLKRWRRPPSA